MTATLTRLQANSTPRSYDTENPAEVADVKKEFDDLVAKGWKAYDDQGEPIDDLNTQGETQLLPRLVGG